MAAHCLVVDNGGGSIKAGFTTQNVPRVLPNCITKAKSERRRQFIADQLDDCKDMSGLFYLLPFQKGYLVNWEVEKQVWDYMFGKDVFNCQFEETCLILTEPFFNFPSIRESLVEVLYEEYQFHSLLLTTAGALSALKYRKERVREIACVVVDSGFSFTHIAPFLRGKLIKAGIRRINLGGKALTNHLKDIVSYRQLHVMDETYVMNQVKEDACFVSTSFNEHMKIAQKHGAENTVARDYVLPDYTVIKRGYIRPLEETTGRPKDNEQLLRLSNERFTVPELLFHPTDIGVDEMGIPEAINYVVETLPKEMRPHMLKNVLLTGGNACFPAFGERVYTDLRSLCPEICEVNVTAPDNPITYAWHGGVMAFQDPDMNKLIVTKKQYEENGTAFCLEKFDS
ncbi:actin-related protein 6 [Dermacentor albipictus]|uniref:actin-related protein 6 n=1 Tax=Dermacentor albipictus TaxID=60249 RepID=UPI0038FCFB9C